MSRDDSPDAHAQRLARLFASIADGPARHDFFALMRAVEAADPARPRWGRALRPRQEALRLGQDAALDFAPAALSSWTPPGRAAGSAVAPRLGVRFFGLTGPQGPLPLHLTEHVRDRAQHRGDLATARFLDLFHHRLLVLLYRAWSQGQPVVQRDRPGEDRFAAWLGTALGWGPATRGLDHVPDEAKLHHAGTLSSRARHPEGLVRWLGDLLRVPVAVCTHVPQRLWLDEADRCRLGGGPFAPRLGRDATAGRFVRDRQSRFRVRLGPLTLAQYEDLLPGGRAWPVLADAVPLYAGRTLRWDAALVLQPGQRPAPRLGGRARLGLSAWIGRPRPAPSPGGPRDPDDDGPGLHLRPGQSFLLRDPGVPHG